MPTDDRNRGNRNHDVYLNMGTNT